MPPTKEPSGAVVTRAKRNADGEDVLRAVVVSKRRPAASTTSRAVVLRHGRHGIWGDGQVAYMKKISGQEKLALLAGALDGLIETLTRLRLDEIKSSAVSPSFSLDKLQKTARAEFTEAIDLISYLHDPDFFHDDISNIIASRPKLKPQNQTMNAAFVARIIATRVHNAYLLASSWKIVMNALGELKGYGLTGANVRARLRGNNNIRDAYLLVVDTVDMLCTLAQQELSISVVGSNELGGLFSGNKTSKGFAFSDASSLLAAHRSLIDAIIIELVLPNSRYEPYILTAALRDALDTTPREEVKKFSQTVFDALGNLSVLIDMKNMLLGPLLNSEGEEWLKSTRKNAEGEIDEFFDAIAQSAKASSEYSRWASWVFPLQKTANKAHLETVWTQINTVYVDETGHNIDTLWRLEAEREITPSYSTWFIPEASAYADDLSSEDEQAPYPFYAQRSRPKPVQRQRHSYRKPKNREPAVRKAITADDGGEDDEYDDMPGLMSVSESSDDGHRPMTSEEGESDEDSESEGDEGSESEWEDEEKRQINGMLADAMREYTRRNGKLPPWTQESDEGKDKENKGNLKANPFLKMLRTYMGRLFDTDPMFKPEKMGGKPMYGPPRPPEEPPKKAAPPKPKGMTVDSTDDEDDIKADEKKKKKKKPKKKKKKATTEEAEEAKEAADVASPLPDTITPLTSPKPSVQSLTTPASKKVPNPNVAAARGVSDQFGSTTSLPIAITPATAQSAHSYLGKEVEVKVKVKTRADPSTVKEPEHKSFFSRLTRKSGKKEKEGKEEERQVIEIGEEENKEREKELASQRGVFQLPTRARTLVARLLGSKEDEKKGQAGMRWGQFVKAMNLMGFKEDNSSQGSRVTFYPPNPNDIPLVIHRPHPDPTIYPVLLNKIGKKLKEHYGWVPAHFELKGNTDIAFDDDLD